MSLLDEAGVNLDGTPAPGQPSSCNAESLAALLPNVSAAAEIFSRIEPSVCTLHCYFVDMCGRTGASRVRGCEYRCPKTPHERLAAATRCGVSSGSPLASRAALHRATMRRLVGAHSERPPEPSMFFSKRDHPMSYAAGKHSESVYCLLSRVEAGRDRGTPEVPACSLACVWRKITSCIPACSVQ